MSSRSSFLITTFKLSSILFICSLSPSIMTLHNLRMGFIMNSTKVLVSDFPEGLSDSVVQHFLSLSK